MFNAWLYLVSITSNQHLPIKVTSDIRSNAFSERLLNKRVQIGPNLRNLVVSLLLIVKNQKYFWCSNKVQIEIVT